MGEFLKRMPKNDGARGVGVSGVPPENPTLAEIGITKKQSSSAGGGQGAELVRCPSGTAQPATLSEIPAQVVPCRHRLPFPRLRRTGRGRWSLASGQSPTGRASVVVLVAVRLDRGAGVWSLGASRRAVPVWNHPHPPP